MNAIEKIRLLEKLQKDPGFLLLNMYVQEQVDQLQREVLFAPCNSMDELIQSERKKGQLEGRLSWSALITTMIDNFKLDVVREKESEDGRSDGEGSDTDGSGTGDGKAP